MSKAPVVQFQAAGAEGGGVLTPGDVFPPKQLGHATLQRKTDSITVNIHTSGLPAGAYTVWWIVFNRPDQCAGACDEADLFHPDAEASVFWATGGVVGANGIGHFKSRHGVHDSRGIAGIQDIINGGGIDPNVAEVHNVIKYHGPAAEDPDLLWEQTHTLLGSCSSGANAVDLGPPFGVQCFDPQVVAHPLP